MKHPFSYWDCLSPTDPTLKGADLKGVIRHIEVRDIQPGTDAGMESSLFHKSNDTSSHDVFLAGKIKDANSYVRGERTEALQGRRAMAYFTVDTVEGHPCILQVYGVTLFVSVAVHSTSIESTRTFATDVMIPHMRDMIKDANGYVVSVDKTLVADGFQMADQHRGTAYLHLIRVAVSSVSARRFFENPKLELVSALNQKDPNIRIVDLVMRDDRESDMQQVLLQMGSMPLTSWMRLNSPEERAKVACGALGCGTSIVCPKRYLSPSKMHISRYGRELTTSMLSNIEVLKDGFVPPTHHVALDCEMVSAVTEEQALLNLEKYDSREPFPQPSDPNHQVISVSLCHWLERNAATTHMEFLVLEVGPGGTEDGLETELTHPSAFAQAEVVRQKTMDKVKMTCGFPTSVRRLTFGDSFQMIRALFKYISHGPFVAMHGHNLHSFDLPYLWRYYIAHSKDPQAEKRAVFWTPFIGVEVAFKHTRQSDYDASKLLSTHTTASFGYAWRASPMVIADTMIMEMFMKPKHTVDGMKLENLTKNIFGVGGKMEGMSGAKVTEACLKGQLDDIHVYCAIDTWLSMRINTFLKIYDSMCMLAQLANINPCFLATNPTTSKGLLFNGMLANVAFRYSHVMRSKLPDFPHNNCGYPGGFVVDPKETGILKNIFTLDFNSLYPSIIAAFNLCYSTILGIYSQPVKKDKGPPFDGVPYTEHVVEMKAKEGAADDFGEEDDFTTAGAAKAGKKGGKKEELFKVYVYIRKADGPGGKVGILPILCQHLIKLRKEFKKQKASAEAARDAALARAKDLEGAGGDEAVRNQALLDAAVEEAKASIFDIQQGSTKVVTNSVYGILGSVNAKLACKVIAALVTQIGRNSIQKVPQFLCERYKNGKRIFEDLADLLEKKEDPPAYIVFDAYELLQMWKEQAKESAELVQLVSDASQPVRALKERLAAQGKKAEGGLKDIVKDAAEGAEVRQQLAKALRATVQTSRIPWSPKEGVDIVAGDTDSVMIRLRPGAFLPPFNQDSLKASLIHMDLVGWVCSLTVKEIPSLAHSAMNMEHEDNCLMFIIRANTKKRYLKLFASPGKHEERSKKIQGFASKKSDSRTITSNMQQALENTILSFNNFGGNLADLQEKLISILIHHLACAAHASGQACILAHNEDRVQEEELYRSALAWSKLGCISAGKTAQVLFKGDVCPFTIEQIQDGKFVIDGKPVTVSGDGQHVALKRWALQGKPVELNVTEVQSVVMKDMHIMHKGQVKTLVFEHAEFVTHGEEAKMKINNSGKTHPKLWDLSVLEQAIGLADESDGLRRPRLDIAYMLGMECNGVVDLLVCVLPRSIDNIVQTIQALYRQAVKLCLTSLISDKPMVIPVAKVENLLRSTYAEKQNVRDVKQMKMDGFFKKKDPAALALPAPPPPPPSSAQMDTSPDRGYGMDLHCEMRFNGNYDLCYQEMRKFFDKPEKYFRFNYKACKHDFGTEEKFKEEMAKLQQDLTAPEHLLDSGTDEDVLEKVQKKKQKLAEKKKRFQPIPDEDEEFDFGADLHCKRRFDYDDHAMYAKLVQYKANMLLYWRKNEEVCVADFGTQEEFIDQFKQVMEDRQFNAADREAERRARLGLNAFERDNAVMGTEDEGDIVKTEDEEEEEEGEEEDDDEADKKKRGAGWRFIDASAASGDEDEQEEDGDGSASNDEKREAALALSLDPIRAPRHADRLMKNFLYHHDPSYRSESEELDEEGDELFEKEFCKPVPPRKEEVKRSVSPSTPPRPIVLPRKRVVASSPFSPVPPRHAMTVQKRKARIVSEESDHHSDFDAPRAKKSVVHEIVDFDKMGVSLGNISSKMILK